MYHVKLARAVEMNNKDIISKYHECKSEKQKYMPLWRDIAKYTGIQVDPDQTKNTGDDLDSYTLDPTCSKLGTSA